MAELQLKSQLQIEAKHSTQLQTQVGQLTLEKEAAAATEAEARKQLTGLQAELTRARERIRSLEDQLNQGHEELVQMTDQMNQYQASNQRNEGQVKILVIEVEQLQVTQITCLSWLFPIFKR